MANGQQSRAQMAGTCVAAGVTKIVTHNVIGKNCLAAPIAGAGRVSNFEMFSNAKTH